MYVKIPQGGQPPFYVLKKFCFKVSFVQTLQDDFALLEKNDIPHIVPRLFAAGVLAAQHKIVCSVLHCLGQVHGGDLRFSVEIGDSAGDS